MVSKEAVIEAEFLMQMRHPNIISIFDCFNLDVVGTNQQPRTLRVITLDWRSTTFAMTKTNSVQVFRAHIDLCVY